MQSIEHLFQAHPRGAPAVFLGLTIFILFQAGYYLISWAVPGAVGLHALFEGVYFICFLAGAVFGWATRSTKTG